MIDFHIRKAETPELDAISSLIQRSKAYWGYDSDFMATCRHELTVTDQDLATSHLVIAELSGKLAGMAQLKLAHDDADLQRLYIDPAFMGRGVGKHLFLWCVAEARKEGATRLLVEADPNAAPFYERMGATQIGAVPSGSIPGRTLPLLALSLR